MIAILTTLVIAGSLAGTTPRALLAERDWKGYVAPGRSLEIRGFNGTVWAVESDNPVAEVHATRYSEGVDPRRFEISVRETPQGIVICAVHPDDVFTGSGVCPPVATPPDDNEARVDFTVHVPPGVRFIGRTVNGDVVAQNLRSDVEAYSVNGAIQVLTSGHAQARTVNGAIFAAMGSTEWPGERELSTVNGEIVVDLPAEASLDLYAESRSGEIESEFPLGRCAATDSRTLHARIGGGHSPLHLKTVNGGIHLRRTL